MSQNIVSRLAALRPSWLTARRLPYVVASLASASAAQTWFRAGHHTAAGDVAPFLRTSLSSEVFSLWNHQLSAAGGISAEIVRIFDVLFLGLADLLGMAPHTIQRLFYTLLAVGTALAATYLFTALTATFARPSADPENSTTDTAPSTTDLGWPQAWLIALLGTLAVVNPYWMVLVPNPIFLAATGLGAAIAAVIWRAFTSTPTRLLYLALGAPFLAIPAVNPPLLAVLLVWALLCLGTALYVLRPSSLRPLVSYFAKASSLALLANLFWILPLGITLFGGTTLVGAEVSPEAWSWSHAQNSIPNVAALNAFWGWAYADVYVPYATRLDEIWWSPLRFALPLTALTALVYALRQPRRSLLRRYGVATGLISAATIVVGKGLHPPFEALNAFLYDHIPGMWLLREPISKVGWVLLLSYLSIVAASQAHRFLPRGDIAARRPATSRSWARPLTAALVTVAAASALVYPHPLYTGAAVPAARADLPGAYVSLPPELTELAEVIAAATSGRVLPLPQPTFYQMSHTWGYHGVDQVLAQALTVPLISPTNGGYFSQPPVFAALVDETVSQILAADPSALDLLARLGVDTLVVRLDYDGRSSQPGLVDPDRFLSALQKLGLEEIYSSPLAVVFSVPTARPPLTAYTPSQILTFDPASPRDWAAAASSLRANQLLLSSQENPSLDASNSALLIGSKPIPLPAPGDLAEVSLRRTGPVSMTLTQDGVLFPTARLFIGDTALPLGASSVPAQLPILAAATPSHAFPVQGSATFLASNGDPVQFFAAAPRQKPSSVPLEDCPDSTQDPSGCLYADLPADLLPSPGAALLLEVDGAPDATLCLSLEDPHNCLRTDSAYLNLLPASHATATPRRLTSVLIGHDLAGQDPLGLGTSQPRAYLVAPSKETLSPQSASLLVTPLLPSGSRYVSLPDRVALPSAAPHTPVSLGFSTTGSEVSPDLFSDLADCNRLTPANPAEAGLSLQRTATALTLTARSHSACVWANLGPVLAPALEVSFMHETHSGRPARFCLWQTAISRCAPASGLSSEAGAYRETIYPETSEGQLHLYLYADAPSSQATHSTSVTYSEIEASPRSRLTALAAPPVVSAQAPELLGADPTPPRALSTASLAADLPAGSTLVFSESFSPWLRLRVNGADVSWTHITADGWANGWVTPEPLPAGSTISVLLPLASLATIGQLLSLITILSALIIVTGTVILPRARGSLAHRLKLRPSRPLPPSPK